MVVVSLGFVLNSLVFKLLLLGVFLFFKEFMVWMIFFLVGILVLILRLIVVFWIFGIIVGGGLFKIFLKCFI